MQGVMLSQSWNEGYHARYAGRSHRLCPYTGVQAQDWLAGWYQANSELS
jgi:ribosome modulation factor